MKKQMVIVVDGKEYPCYPTMGACVRFHDMTGKDVAEIKGWQTSMQCLYLFCCVKAACEREKKEFPYEPTEFCDNVPLDALYSWLQAEAEKVTEEEAEKKKSVGIEELTGMALGVVGLSFGDFCRLTFGEFEAVMRAHNERETLRHQGEWERMRLHAVMTMQPHCKHRLNPRKVLPFDWEEPHRPGHNNPAPELSKAEVKQAFMRRIQKSKG